MERRNKRRIKREEDGRAGRGRVVPTPLGVLCSDGLPALDGEVPHLVEPLVNALLKCGSAADAAAYQIRLAQFDAPLGRLLEEREADCPPWLAKAIREKAPTRT